MFRGHDFIVHCFVLGDIIFKYYVHVIARVMFAFLLFVFCLYYLF